MTVVIPISRIEKKIAIKIHISILAEGFENCTFLKALPSLLAESSVFPTLRTVTNPYSFSLDGLTFSGTSGQNTDDVLRNSGSGGEGEGGRGPLDALSSMLDWSHLAPTCPDTLGCYPYRDKVGIATKNYCYANLHVTALFFENFVSFQFANYSF